LTATYCLIALLCFFAAVQLRLTMYLTGYWYNDSPRLFAILPVVGLPLAVLGADALRRAVQQVLSRRLGRDNLSWRNRRIALSTASGLVVCLGIVLLQAGLGTARVSQVVAVTNQCSGPACLVTQGAQKVYAQLAQTMAPEETIAGDPFTGEILAGQLAGHSAIYVTFGASKDPTAALVGLRFRYYREDHLVCAAVKTLNIGVILTGRKFHGETPEKRAPFVGFNFGEDPASIGLTKIASGGGLTAYRVGSCNSYDYPKGRMITPGQEAMFKQLASNAPAGMSVVGDPFTGAIFAGILSHRVGIFQNLAAPTDLASALVGAKFSAYQNDWLVCAAVRSLKIGTAVDGRTYPGQTRADHAAYVGFDRLGTIPGLTPMVDKGTGLPLSGGGATAYSVGSCGTQ
ncbi:MAG TPA: DUF6541 family protein, partial [Marmoricola sp.]|nr:DUF6541 family protein [Marmoricola sp.]